MCLVKESRVRIQGGLRRRAFIGLGVTRDVRPLKGEVWEGDDTEKCVPGKKWKLDQWEVWSEEHARDGWCEVKLVVRPTHLAHLATLRAFGEDVNQLITFLRYLHFCFAFLHVNILNKV